MSSLILESMLRFLYNDMPAAEQAEFLLSIESNPAMMEQFDLLRQGMEALTQLSFSPATETLQSIALYASKS